MRSVYHIPAILLGLSLAFLLPGGAAQAQTASAKNSAVPKIEMLGTVLGEGDKANTGEEWWAFCRNEDGSYELLRTKITVEVQPDGCFSGYRTISIEQDRRLRFLLRGLTFDEGPVQTGPSPVYFRLLPGERRHIKGFGRGYAEIFALGCAEGQGYIITDYSIDIVEKSPSGNLSQKILHLEETYTEEEFPKIEWIGDLDGDGKTDLLINARPYPGGWLILFLSSLAEEGELVGKAGEIFLPAC